MKFPKLFAVCTTLLSTGTVFSSDIWENRVQILRTEIIYGASPVSWHTHKAQPMVDKFLEQIRVVYSFAPEKPSIEEQTVVGISIFFGEQELIVPKELFADYPNISLSSCTGMRNGGFALKFNANLSREKGNRKGVPWELIMDVQNSETKPVFRIVRVQDIETSPIEKYARFFPVVAITNHQK